MKHLYRYILFLFLLIGSNSWGQSFTTRVSSKLIGKKDLLQVEYIAENIELSDFKDPVFKGWSIQSGPNFTSNQMQNGNIVKQQIIYSFILQPEHAGKLSVPSATITIDHNNSRQSNTVTVDVKDVDHLAGSSVQQSTPVPSIFDDPPSVPEEDFAKEQVLRKGENPLDKIKNNLLVKLDVSKTTCFAGEPVIATYKLCTRLRSESRVVKQPAFNGCTVTELTSESPTSKQEKINGRMYNVYVIRKVQLIPLQPGALVLPEASVDNKVSFYKADKINFRDLYYNPSASDVETRQLTLSSKPVTINVQALPAAPSNFSGAIGKFRITSLLANNTPVTTKNTSTLQVVIEGEGNLQDMKAPTIIWPAGIEGFDPADEVVVDKSGITVTVSKTFSYPFVVNKPGNYTIPVIRFNYFNPSSAQYATALSEPFTFNAQKGRNSIIAALTKRDDDTGFQMHLYILLGVALLAVAAGLLFFNRRYKSKPVAAASAVAVPVDTVQPPVQDVAGTDQFIQAIRHLNPMENGGFYKQLHKYILGYLKAKYNITEDGIDALAESHPADSGTLLKIKSLLNNCSLGMYTPMFNTEEEMQHRLLAIELLTNLEKDNSYPQL